MHHNCIASAFDVRKKVLLPANLPQRMYDNVIYFIHVRSSCLRSTQNLCVLLGRMLPQSPILSLNEQLNHVTPTNTKATQRDSADVSSRFFPSLCVAVHINYPNLRLFEPLWSKFQGFALFDIRRFSKRKANSQRYRFRNDVYSMIAYLFHLT